MVWFGCPPRSELPSDPPLPSRPPPSSWFRDLCQWSWPCPNLREFVLLAVTSLQRPGPSTGGVMDVKHHRPEKLLMEVQRNPRPDGQKFMLAAAHGHANWSRE